MTEPSENLATELSTFYAALEELRRQIGRDLSLDHCQSTDITARRGVYFFFEEGEMRGSLGAGRRVVRVGTHAPNGTEKSTLWQRLRQHRGNAGGGGNCRGSIFRKHVGFALMQAGRTPSVPEWARGNTTSREQRKVEHDTECAVSAVIRRMPFLFLAVDEKTDGHVARRAIETGAIALLSTPFARNADPPSAGWLGHHAINPLIRDSGLWNVQEVGKAPHVDFLNRLGSYVRRGD